MRQFNKPSDFDRPRMPSNLLTAAAMPSKPADEMASLLQKVLESKAFMGLPDWVHTYPIPYGTIASTLPPVAAWMEACKLKKTMRLGIHPVNTIETLLTTTEVTMTGDVLQYVDDKKETKVIQNNRGYHIIESTNTAPIIAAAYVSDLVPYYARGDGKGNAVPTVFGDSVSKLQMKTVNTLSLRAELTPYTASETISRDVVYKYMESNPDQAFMVCNALCLANVDCAGRSENALAYYREARKKDVALPDLEGILLPVVGKGTALNMTMTMDNMYRFLADCRKVRGEDGGIGSLTFGYLFGACTRSMVKSITHFLDIRQLTTVYKTNVVAISGRLSEFVKRMCVANRIFILDSTSVNGKTLGMKEFDGEEYGVYSNLTHKIKYGIYYIADSRAPEVKDENGHQIVKYDSFAVPELFALYPDVASTVVFQAVRCHMHPNMESKQFKLQLLPCALPHNAVVIVAVPFLTKLMTSTLIERTVASNHHRNNWLITRRSYLVLDKLSGQVAYQTKFIIPKMLTKMKKVATDWSAYFKEVADDRERLAREPDVVVDDRIKRKALVFDPELACDDIMDTLLSFGSISDGIVTMFKCWGQDREFRSLRALRTNNIMECDVITMLGQRQKDPARAEEIRKGYAKLLDLRVDAERKRMASQTRDASLEAETVIAPVNPNASRIIQSIACREDGDTNYNDVDE